MQTIDQAGGFRLGEREVRRLGYGAMQLAGPGVFGPPRCRSACCCCVGCASLRRLPKPS